MVKRKTRSSYVHAFVYLKLKERAVKNEVTIADFKEVLSFLIKIKKKYYFLICKDMIEQKLIDKVNKDKIVLADASDEKIDHWKTVMEEEFLWD